MKKLTSLAIAIAIAIATTFTATAVDEPTAATELAEISDALAILRDVVGLPQDIATVMNHDFNGNGELDLDDALIALRGIVGLAMPAVLGEVYSREPEARPVLFGAEAFATASVGDIIEFPKPRSSGSWKFEIVRDDAILRLEFAEFDPNRCLFEQLKEENEKRAACVTYGRMLDDPIAVSDAVLKIIPQEQRIFDELIRQIVTADKIEKVEVTYTVEPHLIKSETIVFETTESDAIDNWVSLMSSMKASVMPAELLLGGVHYTLNFYVDGLPLTIHGLFEGGYIFIRGENLSRELDRVMIIVENYAELRPTMDTLLKELGFSLN